MPDPGRFHLHLTDEELSSYLDGYLDATERGRVEAHLAGCSECAVVLEELRATVALLRQLPRVPVPHSFAIPADTARAATRPGRRFQLFFAARAATAMMAALFVLLVVGDLSGALRPPAPPRGAPVPEDARLAPAAGSPALLPTDLAATPTGADAAAPSAPAASPLPALDAEASLPLAARAPEPGDSLPAVEEAMAPGAAAPSTAPLLAAPADGRDQVGSGPPAATLIPDTGAEPSAYYVGTQAGSDRAAEAPPALSVDLRPWQTVAGALTALLGALTLWLARGPR